MRFVPAKHAAEDWEADIPLLRTLELVNVHFVPSLHSKGDSLNSPPLEGVGVGSSVTQSGQDARARSSNHTHPRGLKP